MKKLIALSFLLATSSIFAQDLDLPPPPESGKYEEASTRGVELCMNLNYILATELKAAIIEKHKKTPFIDAQELLLLTEFEPYRVTMLNSALLGAFLTDAAADLVDGYIPDEDTIKKVNIYYLNSARVEVNKTITMCDKYVDIIRVKIDPNQDITNAIEGQKKLLSENLFKELQAVEKN